jgi:hypothetical protein
LQSLCTTYEHWWEENAFIDEIKDAWFEFVLDGKTKSDSQQMTKRQQVSNAQKLLNLF